MVKVIRVAIVALVLHLLVVAGAGARESYCRSALDRCISQCEAYPGMFRTGCTAGCYLGFLVCD